MKKLTKDWNTNIYCLIGDPVKKSLSPKIHNYIFEANNINSVYVCFNINAKDLKSTLDSFKILGIEGFNVTVPHKIKIMNYLDEIDDEARYLGAVNTVKNVEGRFIGYNTDGLGFIKSLEDRNIDIINKDILILGAGGASHAISTKLALEGVNKIIILNRTLSKGKKLASEIHEKFDNVKLECDTLDNFYKYLDIDMIVNCTTIGMYPDIDSSPVDLSMFNNDIIVYDIVYKPIKTKLLHMAERMGMETIEGIDMLINQGLLSQKIWFNYEIDNLFKDVDELKKLLI